MFFYYWVLIQIKVLWENQVDLELESMRNKFNYETQHRSDEPRWFKTISHFIFTQKYLNNANLFEMELQIKYCSLFVAACQLVIQRDLTKKMDVSVSVIKEALLEETSASNFSINKLIVSVALWDVAPFCWHHNTFNSTSGCESHLRTIRKKVAEC